MSIITFDMGDMTERYLWVVVFAVLIVFAVPWFLWGNDRVVAGLPVWIWWHVGWMAAAAITFRVFAGRAWGLGIEEGR